MTLWETIYEQCFPVAIIKGEKVGQILYINSLVCLSRSSGPSQKANWAWPSTPGLPDFHRPGSPWGAEPGPSQKAGRLSGPLQGWNGHGCSLVPNTGGAGTVVLWFPARAERGLEEERCAAAGEKRGGGGQRREEKKRRKERGLEEERCATAGERRGGGQRREEKKRREILIGADQDQNLFFSVATLSCFQTRSSVSGFLSLVLLRKPNREAQAWQRWW
jgi:hypothetical protein